MLDVLLLFSSICTAVVGGRAPQTITGFRGERVDIRCSYKSGYESNSKYFCKGECSLFNKIIMVESGSRGKDKRFSLTDDTTARVFTVTITDLRTEDQGQYWCGVEGFIFDDYSKIALLVKDGNNTTGVSTISPSSKTPSSSSTTQPSPHSENDTRTTTENTVQLHQPNTSSFVIIVTAEALVLLLIAVPLIIVAVRKKKKNKGLLSSSTVVFIPVIYDQIKDTGLFLSRSQSADITVRGTERDRVSITCSYPEGYENSYKYFYRGPYGDSVLILKSVGESSVSSGRFSLNNNPQHRSFTVSISDLKMDDAGPYSCAAGWGPRLDVQLEVLRAPVIKTPVKISTTSIRPYTNTEHTSTVTGVSPSATHQTETETRTTTENTTVQLQQPNTTLSLDLASVAGGLGSVLLVLTLCCGTFIILKKRKRKSGTDVMMLDVLLLFSSICTAVGGGAPQTITGFRGETLNIRCSYDSRYESNPKYFCKGECLSLNKIIMVKSGSPAKDERFSLTDDTTARVFTVTITDLRTEDEGLYWCAVERSINTDVYSEIMLLVKQDEVSTISSFSKTSSSSYFSTSEPNLRITSMNPTDHHVTDGQASRSGSVIYICVGLVFIMIIFLMALIVLFRKRSKKSSRVTQSGLSQHVAVDLLPLSTRAETTAERTK
ncbi:CMRF35-like molecule [Pimephales promelas]|nr:CMRF35-like molecule [Pimephales promelas]